METPCINVCALTPNRQCAGCYRTLEEIAGWSGFTAIERRRIMDELPNRREPGPDTMEIATE